MRRVYTDLSHAHAPFDGGVLDFSGLGAAPAWPGYPARWPRGRVYVDQSQFRMPYRSGFFQDNSLTGLGVDAPVIDPASIIAQQRTQIAAADRKKWYWAIGGLVIGYLVGR